MIVDPARIDHTGLESLHDDGFDCVAVFAGAVKGIIGFGYALITTPIFATVIDPTFAVVVLSIPPWMINVFQIGETDTGVAFLPDEWLLVLLAVVGTVIGVAFLAEFSAGPTVPFIVGLIIFGYVVFQFAQNFVTIEKAHHPVALSTAGFFQGFLTSVANLGPLLPVYYHTFERDAEQYIGVSRWSSGLCLRSASFRWCCSPIC
nr:sulfite exporter TauE/SafE family protein [Natrinema caseinilyticum]